MLLGFRGGFLITFTGNILANLFTFYLNVGNEHLQLEIARYGSRINLFREFQNQGVKPYENATAKIIKSCLLLSTFVIKIRILI